jgi:hypothetical protein
MAWAAHIAQADYSSKASKSTMYLLSGIGISFGCISFFREKAEMFLLVVNGNGRLPFAHTSAPANPFNAAGVGFWNLAVSLIFAVRRQSQIVPSVIEAVPVDMVNLNACGKFHQEPMHLDVAEFLARRRPAPHGIAGMASRRIQSGPVVPLHKVNVRHVNHGNKSFAQRDEGRFTVNSDRAAWVVVFRHIANSLANYVKTSCARTCFFARRFA